MAFRKSLRRIGCNVTGIIGCFLMISILPSMVFEHPGRVNQKVLGRSSTGNLKRAYKRLVAACGSSSPSGSAVRLVRNKTLSSEYTKSEGIAGINLEEASVHMRIRGCDDNRISEVWLVDNLRGSGRSLLPVRGDGMIHAGSLGFEGANSWLERKINPMQMREVGLILKKTEGSGDPENKLIMGGAPHLLAEGSPLASPMEFDREDVPIDDHLFQLSAVSH